MTRLNQIEAAHGAAIASAKDRFGDHEDMSAGVILGWLEQFHDDDLPLALEVLEDVRYINATNLREMTRQIRDMAIADFGGEHRRIVFVPIGSPGSGSNYLMRVLAALRDRSVSTTTLADLRTLTEGDVDVIVFVEDFSGTGQTLREWWELNESIILPLNAQIVVGVLLASIRAVQHIQSFATLIAVEQLGDEADVFSGDHPLFDESAGHTLLEYCESTACPPHFVRGFGDCGLLVALKHGCPNNSLPILWYSDGGWRPLFHRRSF